MADCAVDYDDSSFSAYFIRGLAYIKANNIEAAKKDLRAASKRCKEEDIEANNKIESILTKVLMKEEGTINIDDENCSIIE